MIIGFQDAAGLVVFNYGLNSQLIRLAFELIQDKRVIRICILVLFLYPGLEHGGFCVTGGFVWVIPECLLADSPRENHLSLALDPAPVLL